MTNKIWPCTNCPTRKNYLDALEYWHGFAKSRIGEMDEEDINKYEELRSLLAAGKAFALSETERGPP